MAGSLPNDPEGPWEKVILNAAGTRVVALGRSATPKLWDAQTGKVIATLNGHTARVNSAAFSLSDFITVGDDHYLRIWDADSGQLKRSYKSHDSLLLDVTLSPSGRRAITIGADATAYLWDLTQSRASPLTNFSILQPMGQFDERGIRYAALNKLNGELWVWNLGRDTDPKLISLHDRFRSFAFVPSGEEVLVGDDTGSLRIFHCDADDPASMPARFRTDAGAPLFIKFLADNNRFVLVTDRGIIEVWDYVSAKKLRSLR